MIRWLNVMKWNNAERKGHAKRRAWAGSRPRIFHSCPQLTDSGGSSAGALKVGSGPQMGHRYGHLLKLASGFMARFTNDAQT